jgi:hypothetical protein
MASYKDYKSVAAAQKAGSMYFVGKDGKKKLAVTKEQLDAWKKKNKGKYKGSALTAWANAKGKDIGGSSKRDSSPRPKLRPGSKKPGPEQGPAADTGATLEEKKVLDAANKANQAARDEKSGKTKTESAGQKFNAWYEANGSKYGTMKEAFEAYQKTLKSGNSKGGMQMKEGRYNKGGMADYRKMGMFYGGMAKKRKA